MAHENLKGISGLLCFLNHPMRESKVANDGVHGEAYNRLLSEARQEYNTLSPAPSLAEEIAAEVCKGCGNMAGITEAIRAVLKRRGVAGEGIADGMDKR